MHQASTDDSRSAPTFNRRSTDHIGGQDMPVFPPRHPSDAMIILSLLHEDVKTVKVSITALDDRLSKHMTDETTELAAAIADIMQKSFPEGDPSGHRKHHELSIKAAEDKAAFWKKMREEVSKYGLISLIGWLSFVAWAAFVKGPKA